MECEIGFGYESNLKGSEDDEDERVEERETRVPARILVALRSDEGQLEILAGK